MTVYQGAPKTNTKSLFQPLPAPITVIDANDDLSKLRPLYLKHKENILKKAESN